MPAIATTSSSAGSGNAGYVIAWGFCLLFYFGQYTIWSSASTVLPELTTAFGLTTLDVSSPLGLYVYTYITRAIVAGAALDCLGPEYVIRIGILFAATGTVMCGLGSAGSTEAGRLLQGAAFAFPGAAYLASHGFSAAYLATVTPYLSVIGHMRGRMSWHRRRDRGVYTRASYPRIPELYVIA